MANEAAEFNALRGRRCRWGKRGGWGQRCDGCLGQARLGCSAWAVPPRLVPLEGVGKAGMAAPFGMKSGLLGREGRGPQPGRVLGLAVYGRRDRALSGWVRDVVARCGFYGERPDGGAWLS